MLSFCAIFGAMANDGAGSVVVAVYIKGSDAAYEAREKTIARIGRAVRELLPVRRPALTAMSRYR
jgi:hypothetical protein